MPALLRPTPSLSDVEAALRTELGRYGDGARQVPNAWSVQLAPRDLHRLAEDLPHWSAVLGDELVQEHLRLGLTASGLVTVAFAEDADVRPGQFRVAAAVSHEAPVVVRREVLVPGRPRLTIATGDTVRYGSPAAAGIDLEVMLAAGRTVIGRDKEADLVLHDPAVDLRHAAIDVLTDGTEIRITDLGSLNGVRVGGRPVAEANLVDGSRVELGQTTLLFHADELDDDGGREGGEGEAPTD